MSYIFFHDIGQFKIASMLSLYFLKSVMELQSWFLITNFGLDGFFRLFSTVEHTQWGCIRSEDSAFPFMSELWISDR